jgi:putative ABC transport system substrate-binding protein
MRRRSFLIAGAALSVITGASAQTEVRVPRVGFLNGGKRSDDTMRFVDAVRGRLRESGWVEGRNIAYELQWADGDAGRLPRMAAELVRLGVDVIVAPSADAIMAAKKATSRIPIVMVYPTNPVTLGFVTSHARPGGNVTGLSTEASTIVAKFLELLAEVVPALSRVAVLWNTAAPIHSKQAINDMKAPAALLKLEVRSYAVRTADDFVAAFARMAEERCGAVIILADTMFFQNRASLAQLALKHRLPAMSSVRDFVEEGGLMRYVPDLMELFRSAARYVDQILKGANPAELPVEQPTKFDLVVNMRTARAISLNIPQAILLRADTVIE